MPFWPHFYVRFHSMRWCLELSKGHFLSVRSFVMCSQIASRMHFFHTLVVNVGIYSTLKLSSIFVSHTQYVIVKVSTPKTRDASGHSQCESISAVALSQQQVAFSVPLRTIRPYSTQASDMDFPSTPSTPSTLYQAERDDAQRDVNKRPKTSNLALTYRSHPDELSEHSDIRSAPTMSPYEQSSSAPGSSETYPSPQNYTACRLSAPSAIRIPELGRCNKYRKYRKKVGFFRNGGRHGQESKHWVMCNACNWKSRTETNLAQVTISTSAMKRREHEVLEASGNDVSSSRNDVDEDVSSDEDESDEDVPSDRETSKLDASSNGAQDDIAPVPVPERAMAAAKARAYGFVPNIFAVTSIHQDLLRCADLPGIWSDNATSATYHIQQYALTVRLNKLHRR
jgi:hypothetical protein